MATSLLLNFQITHQDQTRLKPLRLRYLRSPHLVDSGLGPRRSRPLSYLFGLFPKGVYTPESNEGPTLPSAGASRAADRREPEFKKCRSSAARYPDG